MANLIDNIVRLQFNNDDDLTTRKKWKIIRKFEALIPWYSIFSDEPDTDDSLECIDIRYETSKDCHEEELQEFCNAYNVSIMGVSYCFGNSYVHSFDLSPEKRKV